MKGSNIPIIKNKRHPRPLSNINGKQSNLRTTTLQAGAAEDVERDETLALLKPLGKQQIAF